METKILIIYQSGKQHTQKIGNVIATELKCTAWNIDAVNEAHKPDLEKYDLIGIGSGIYCWSFGRKLKKWLKKYSWTSKEVCKPDAFLFSTAGGSSKGSQRRMATFLQKKCGITSITGWSCTSKMVENADALMNLKDWINHKLKPTNPEPIGDTSNCGCAPIKKSTDDKIASPNKLNTIESK